MFTFMYSSVNDFMCDCFWLQRSVYVGHVIQALSQTMPLNQGVKKKLAIVTAASGIICKHSNVWSFDCESEKEKKKYMNENSIFNFSCLN